MNSDPLNNPDFKEPSLIENLCHAFFGKKRMFDCLQVEVTSYCAGKCIYCPHTTKHNVWKSRNMDDTTFASIWSLLRKSTRIHLQGWGEPFLHPRIFDFVSLSQKAGCQVSSTTCGLHMNDEIANKIAISGMDALAFSLVGTDNQSNSARVNVDFEKVCDAIKKVNLAIKNIKDNDENIETPNIHIAYLMLADRVDAVKKLPELMDELDVSMVVISTLDYIADDAQKELAFLPEEKEKVEYARSILENAKKAALKMDRIIHYALPKDVKYMPSGCRENIANSLYIDADGNLSACIYCNVPVENDYRKKIFGNIKEQDSLSIWACPEYKKFRSDLISGNPDKVCLNCPKRQEQ